MKLKLKQSALKDYMITQSGYTITKTEFTEVDPEARGVKYLLNRPDIEIENVKEVIIDSSPKETIKETIPKETIKDIISKED